MDVVELTDRAACLPTERLEAEITTLAGHLAAAECRWLLLVAEFDRRAAWAHWGCVSASHWLGWKCGLEHRAAQEKVRVARALACLPLITEAFSKGSLSYSQVRALTRIAEPATEVHLLELAGNATAAQLERLVRGYRRVLRDEDDTAAANARHDRRYFAWHWDDDGMLVVHGRLDPEDGALLLGLLTAEEGRSAERSDADPLTRTADRPAGARRADALIAVLERASGEDVSESTNRPEAVIHFDADMLPHGGPGRCELENGPAIAAETARRLTCDATLVPLLESLDGTPLDVGRRTRKISARLRRAVLARDGQCVFPGCHRAGTQIHHRVPWHAGGRTDLDNLHALCRFHHRLVHEGGWSIERDDGTVRFTRPDGTVLDPGPVRGGPYAGDLEERNVAAGVTINATTIQSEWRGDPLDLGWTVHTLCEERARPKGSQNGYGCRPELWRRSVHGSPVIESCVHPGELQWGHDLV